MKRKVFDIFILFMMLLTLNFIVMTQDVGVLVTKSQNIVQFNAKVVKSVQVMIFSYIDWSHSVAEKLVSGDKSRIETKGYGSRIGPVMNNSP